jgi:hypothetical protein
MSTNGGSEIDKGASTRHCGHARRRAKELHPDTGRAPREPRRLLSRTDLRELGLERRAVDAVFRACDVIVLPGYRRPLVRVSDYLELLERSTYGPDRVRLS